MRKLHSAPVRARRIQRGLTLIEFMISIAIGMIVVAALATLIADQSSNRAEVDRAGRVIESGRYAARAVTEDLQMAGYWGELSSAPAAPAAWADPCGADPANPTKDEMIAAMGLHVTGFDVPGAAARPGYNGVAPVLPTTLDCLSNVKAGTDVIVVRRADADSSAYEDGVGVPDVAKLTSAANNNRLFVQTGLEAATNLFSWKADVGANAAATFTLKRKNKTTMATVRRMLARIYYVTTCSVCSGTPDNIPSLKMRELIQGGATLGELAWSDPVTISEGVENLQIEYGVDAAATQDGAPDGADVAGSSLAAVGDWGGVVTVKIYVLARSVEPTPGYNECADPADIPASCKQYPLGLAGTLLPAEGTERTYKRHVFVQTVRLVNPSYRRSL